MVFKKVRIFDLAKVLCFSNQNGHRQVLFMFDIFRLKPFFFRRSWAVPSDVVKTMVFSTQSGRHLPKTNAKRSLLDFSRLRGLPRL